MCQTADSVIKQQVICGILHFYVIKYLKFKHTFPLEKYLFVYKGVSPFPLVIMSTRASPA